MHAVDYKVVRHDKTACSGHQQQRCALDLVGMGTAAEHGSHLSNNPRTPSQCVGFHSIADDFGELDDCGLGAVVHRGYQPIVGHKARHARSEAGTTFSFAFQVEHLTCCGARRHQNSGVIDGEHARDVFPPYTQLKR